MPVLDPLVRFQLSGGNLNENPNLSLGGQVSTATNRNIQSNFLHNLFDEVQKSEAVSGEYEYRHFYYRNSHDFKVRNVKLMVIADQTSIWSKVEFAKGTANNGLVEQAVPDENTAPVGISDNDWSIPNAANPIVLGDVEAGSTASVWCRRRVEPGSLIAKGEKVIIRIIADPPVPVAPPITCPSGQHYDSTTNTCVDDEEEPDDCPTGQHRDTNGNCVPNTGTPCPEGQVLVNGQCVPIGSPPPPTPVKVIAVGDISCGSAGDTTISHIGSLNPHLFIAAGDLSYSSTGTCFTDNLEDANLDTKTKIAIGNHDDDEDESTTIRNSYISYFSIPSTGYYSFNLQNIHFLIMDTQSSYSSSSAQFTFVRNDLIAASTNASIDWIVVCYHKPSMTMPSDYGPLTDFRDIYHPLFDTYKVDIIINGHNHNMQRSYPVRHNASSPSSPTVAAGSSANNIYTDIDGRIFVISGAGGRTRDDIGSMPSHYAFGEDGEYGFFMMDWSNNNKTMVGSFIVSNSSGTNEILHQFTINKSQ